MKITDKSLGRVDFSERAKEQYYRKTIKRNQVWREFTGS